VAWSYAGSSQRHLLDSQYALLTSEALLRNGTWNIEPYLPGTAERLAAPGLRHVERRRLWQLFPTADGRLVYLYPPGTPLFSAPLLALARPFGATVLNERGFYSRAAEWRLQILFAALLAALTVGVTHRLALRELGLGPATAVAAIAAFGSPLWSTASRFLWSHTWTTLWVALALLELLRWEDGERRRPLTLGLLLSAAFWSRPTAALIIAPITLFVWQRHRPALSRLVAAGAVGALSYLAWSRLVWGHWLPPYATEVSTHHATQGAHGYLGGVVGQLVSKNHGLFVFSPVLIAVVLALLVRGLAAERRAFAILSVTISVVYVLFYATRRSWWGPGTEGTRFLTDVTPCLAWLGAHAWARAAGSVSAGRLALARRVAIRFVVGLLVAASVAAHATGAIQMDWRNARRARRHAAAKGSPATPAPARWWYDFPQGKLIVWVTTEWWPRRR